MVGFDSLGEKDRLTLECTRSIREDFLQQNAFREVDRFTPPEKQAEMLDIILGWFDLASAAVKDGASCADATPEDLMMRIAAMKYEPEDTWVSYYQSLRADLQTYFRALAQKGGDE